MSKEEKSLYEQMGRTYTEIEGLLYPNIEIDDVNIFCGKYGDMWKKYMMENHHVRYRSLMLAGKLNETAKLVNEEAYVMLDCIEQRYLKKNNPASSLEMWQVREMIKMVAEETILSDIVYKTR